MAIATSVLTVITFALALTALPDKVPYLFTAVVIAQQWPGDSWWMFPAMLLMVLFVALVAVVHECAPPDRRVYNNPNGVFIALEELGYLLMSLVFLCLAPVFIPGGGVRRVRDHRGLADPDRRRPAARGDPAGRTESAVLR